MRKNVDAATRKLIETVVAQHLDGHDIHPKDIFIETDEDGVESFSIKLAYEFSDRPVNPAVSLDMQVAISDSLQRAGDRRFPYVDYEFDDRQLIKSRQLAI